MASVRVSSLNKSTHDELCCTYAALILHDEKLEVTANLMKKLITASGNQVEGYWPNLFAKALHGKNITDLLLGGGGAAGHKESPKKSPKQAAAKKESPKKEAKKVVEEKPVEEDVDMGGLFDF